MQLTDTCMTYKVIFDSLTLLELFKVTVYFKLRKVNILFDTLRLRLTMLLFMI